MLLTHDHHKQLFSFYEGPIVTLNEQESYEETPLNFQSNCHPEDLVYIIYTSGSTGYPKGVEVKQRSVMILLNNLQKKYDITSKDRILFSSSPCFDASIEEYLLSLTSGATCVLLPPDVQYDPDKIINYLERHQVTGANLVPALLQAIVEAQSFLEKASNLPLRYVSIGGDILKTQVAQKFKKYSNAKLFNIYGPTENTVNTLWFEYNEAYKHNNSVPIGSPLPGTKVYILDKQLKLLPPGIPGELYITGEGLARGYLNRPDLTAERFIPNPFATHDDIKRGYTRLYKTGDLVRYLDDENIEFLGRMDFQIKIRGFRIELGEIEYALNQHYLVKDTLVIAHKEELGQEYLAAYITLQKEAEDHSQERIKKDILQSLEQKLPKYMIPQVVIILEHFPLNAVGKIDRKALPKPEPCSKTNVFVAPRNHTELILTNLWKEVLKLNTISINDNFFYIGGHSLLAIQLVKNIEKAFKLQLPVITLFTHPTIEAMSQLLESQHIIDDKNPIVTLKTGENLFPIFIVHPISGQVFCYQELSQHLSQTQALYGLQQVEEAKKAESIEHLAKIYLKAIKNVQSKGPYFLAGWSMGGMIAHEIAYQLECMGEHMAQVIMIDSFYKIAATENKQLIMSFKDRTGPINTKYLKAFCDDFWRCNKKHSSLSVDTLNLKTIHEQLEIILKAAKNDLLVSESFSMEDLKQTLIKIQHNYILVLEHQPKLIHSPLVLINALKMSENEFSQDWQCFTSKTINKHEFDCDHYEIIQSPLVKYVADTINFYLGK